MKSDVCQSQEIRHNRPTDRQTDRRPDRYQATATTALYNACVTYALRGKNIRHQYTKSVTMTKINRVYTGFVLAFVFLTVWQSEWARFSTSHSDNTYSLYLSKLRPCLPVIRSTTSWPNLCEPIQSNFTVEKVARDLSHQSRPRVRRTICQIIQFPITAFSTGSTVFVHWLQRRIRTHDGIDKSYFTQRAIVYCLLRAFNSRVPTFVSEAAVGNKWRRQNNEVTYFLMKGMCPCSTKFQM